MPTIIVHTLELTEEQKASLASKYTELLAEALHMPKDMIYVLFNGYSLDSLAVAGHLISENPPGPDSWVSKYTVDLKKKLAQEAQESSENG
jgi:4-oxalocrotonate tautomerase